ncbi:hypothetical protein [Bacteriophage Eos]|nr:hypothetical protein [Bacteriophage Eos]
MERTIARVTTMQSINAKASKQEANKEFVSEILWQLDDSQPLPPYLKISDLIDFVASVTIGDSMTELEAAEEIAAAMVLTAQLLREKENERP